ncbi:hypothetical protein INT44_007373 [Umbelopsis vinacea]|uniref:Uncharacterized protein n=1 Tax=Umbelopsis vinacea TaxID=44442 RepID=A0A8H7UES1_9FUNG|nr:hypothetical protein INT44_007373 [Umbelopsis vinacea]KAI9286471.1 hypothetical protein BC943DRAFT_359058 [Umbelopsis sp. AD052]
MQHHQHHSSGAHHEASRDPILNDEEFSFHFSEPISTIHDSKLHHFDDKEFASSGAVTTPAIGAVSAANDDSDYVAPRTGRPPIPISRDSNSSFSHKGGVVCEESFPKSQFQYLGNHTR